MLTTILHAQTQVPSQAPKPTKKKLDSGMFFPLVIIILITYFVVLRPQLRRQKAIEKKRKTVQKGDKVLFSSGVYGVVSQFKEEGNILIIEIAKGVQIEILRSAISEVFPKEDKNHNKNYKKTPKK